MSDAEATSETVTTKVESEVKVTPPSPSPPPVSAASESKEDTSSTHVTTEEVKSSSSSYKMEDSAPSIGKTAYRTETKEYTTRHGSDTIFSEARKPYYESDEVHSSVSHKSFVDSMYSGMYPSVSENINKHPLIVQNRPDDSPNTQKLSSRSRYVIRTGYDLGFTSPQLRRMYETRIEELEEELETERSARAKAEKQRVELSREFDALGERLDEAGGATEAQLLLNKKREGELHKLRQELEDHTVQSEALQLSMKKKHQEAISELSDQVEQLNKHKQRAEKEKNLLRSELDGLQSQVEQLTKEKASSEKLNKQLESQLSDVNHQLSESTRNITDLQGHKLKYQTENKDLGRQIEELENQVIQLGKAKTDVFKQVEEAKTQLEEESRLRSKAQNEVRILRADMAQLHEQLEEEQEGRAEAQRQLTKANNENTVWRQKHENGECGIKPEDVDDLKRKMNSRIAEADSALEAAHSKINSLEKARQRANADLEEMMAKVERSQNLLAQAEKKQRTFEKSVDDWKRKCADIQTELEKSNAESRAHAAEVYKCKAQIEEAHENMESLRRENKNLSDEIQDLTDRLSEGGRSVHDLEKIRKRLEMEKEQLQSALEEVESALEQEEGKVARAQIELTSVRQDIEHSLAQKDEEFESTRKNLQRSLDSLHTSLEAEVRGKSEALRQKKKLEQDITELETALEASHRGRADLEKNMKKYQLQVREVQQHFEEEVVSREQAVEQQAQAERRAALLAGEIEELRCQLESAERAHKAAEGELHEAEDRVTELTSGNATLASIRKKLETDVAAMTSDLEDQSHELKIAEDQAKKAMADAARLAEELRQEQEHSSQIEKMRRTHEHQVKELQTRLDEAEAAAMKGGQRIVMKLEQRIRELEVELDKEQRIHGDSQKNLRKQDRRVKELAVQADEDRKAQDRLQDMIEKLQNKIKTYKRQSEEAEEIAAINLAKYRKIQHELGDAEERADMAENTLSKLRGENRLCMSTTRTSISPTRTTTHHITMSTRRETIES